MDVTLRHCTIFEDSDNLSLIKSMCLLTPYKYMYMYLYV